MEPQPRLHPRCCSHSVRESIHMACGWERGLRCSQTHPPTRLPFLSFPRDPDIFLLCPLQRSLHGPPHTSWLTLHLFPSQSLITQPSDSASRGSSAALPSRQNEWTPSLKSYLLGGSPQPGLFRAACVGPEGSRRPLLGGTSRAWNTTVHTRGLSFLFLTQLVPGALPEALGASESAWV